MAEYYKTGKAHKFVEEDVYKEGCLPETCKSFEVDIQFQADTLRELLQEIKQYYDITNDDFELNGCGDEGRLDINILETKDAYKATEHDIELWKQGRKKLYACVYTYYVTKIHEERVKL